LNEYECKGGRAAAKADARRQRRTRGGKGKRASAARRRREEGVRAQGEDGAIAVFIGAL
jgi:hypothetical protein